MPFHEVTRAEKERKAEIVRRVSVRASCHYLAMRPLGEGSDICAMQELLGHRDVKTTICQQRARMC
jgi:site-specific recombinase XerD